MKTQEALKLALEALESCGAGDYSTGHVIHPSFDVDAVNRAIDAVDEALAEQSAKQQEPVAWIYEDELPEGYPYDDMYGLSRIIEGVRMFPVNLAPPASKPLPEDYTALEQALTRLQKRYADLEGRASKPLTDEQIKLVMDGRGEEGDDDYVEPVFDPFGIAEDDLLKFARAIEAAHGIKEKNA